MPNSAPKSAIGNKNRHCIEFLLAFTLFSAWHFPIMCVFVRFFFCFFPYIFSLLCYASCVNFINSGIVECLFFPTHTLVSTFSVSLSLSLPPILLILWRSSVEMFCCDYELQLRWRHFCWFLHGVCAFVFSFQMLSLLPDVRYASLNCPPCVPRYSARQFNRPPTDRPLATIIVYLIILFLSSLRGRLRRLRRRMTDEWVSVSVSRCYHWFYINSQHSCLLAVLLCSRYC